MDRVTISRSLFESLVEASAILIQLEANGVEEWKWYYQATHSDVVQPQYRELLAAYLKGIAGEV